VSTPRKLAAFAIALLALLGSGVAVGAAAGPKPDRSTEDEAPMPIGEGVVAAAEGYRLVPAARQLAQDGGTYRFVILGRDGRPQHDFTPLHDRLLHLIVVNRELTVFHHVHPTLAADGTWSVRLPAVGPGSYRAVADFHVDGGPRLALGTDLVVPGEYRPTTPPAPARTVHVDGYDVTLASTQGRGGVDAIDLTVRTGGRLVTDLQPYLGASGHLVAMRAGDLAYAHVHPLEYEHGTIHFEATLPAAGRYRLFLDFKHGDEVRTAAFTFDQALVTGNPPAMGH
jgi:hypothetical protein